jgi:hypothetical protein
MSLLKIPILTCCLICSVVASQSSSSTTDLADAAATASTAGYLAPDMPPVKKSRSDYLHQFEDEDNVTAPVVTDEVSTYLQTKVHITDKFDILDWWRVNSSSFPRLSTVAKEVLAIPASSAASERSFSTAGATVSQRRTALNTDTVENILFVHSNFN